MTIVISSFKDRETLENILTALLEKTLYENFNVMIIDYGSIKLGKILEKMNELYPIPVTFIQVKIDEGVTNRRNLGLFKSLSYRPKYVVMLDDDILVTDPNWLNTLVEIMTNAPKDVVVIEPGNGWSIYPNGTTSAYDRSNVVSNDIWPCLCGGGAKFLVKASYIEELFIEGIKPYNELFYMQSEDIDFAIKVYLRGYKSICTNRTELLHLGETKKTKLRISEMYKNRVILLMTNFSAFHIIKYMPYRILNDLIYAFFVFPFTTEYNSTLGVIYLIKSYYFVLKRLREIFQIRKGIQDRWKKEGSIDLYKYVLKRPMPTRMNNR